LATRRLLIHAQTFTVSSCERLPPSRVTYPNRSDARCRFSGCDAYNKILVFRSRPGATELFQSAERLAALFGLETGGRWTVRAVFLQLSSNHLFPNAAAAGVSQLPG